MSKKPRIKPEHKAKVRELFLNSKDNSTTTIAKAVNLSAHSVSKIIDEIIQERKQLMKQES